ncbi:MAG: DUF58 domain-containing protein [Actinomycetia bacterium]|nr:DUF58 domain-containing protein [Actinomycetes bacterium]
MALLTKVKTRMAVHAHRKVRGLLDGAYASVQLGRSMDFFDLREYVPGDEVKDIDWKSSARRGELLVKRFVADRKHTVLLCVSTSQTMAALCSPPRSACHCPEPCRCPRLPTYKRDVAVLAAGILGWLAVRHGDWVSLVHGNREQVHWLRPASREDALERMLQQIQAGCQPESPEPALGSLLDYVVRSVRRRTILVVIADDVDLDGETEHQLNRLRAQHEVLFLTIGDLDPTDPALGRTGLVDQAHRLAWPPLLRSAELHRAVAAEAAQRHQRRGRQLDRLGIAGEHITDEADVIGSIFTLLERHRHARA